MRHMTGKEHQVRYLYPFRIFFVTRLCASLGNFFHLLSQRFLLMYHAGFESRNYSRRVHGRITCEYGVFWPSPSGFVVHFTKC
jgi:hypothetical protein